MRVASESSERDSMKVIFNQTHEKAWISKMREEQAERPWTELLFWSSEETARNLVSFERAREGLNWNQRTKQWVKPPRASILKAVAFTLSEIRGSGRFLSREATGITFKKKSELTLKISCLELAKLSPKFQEFTMKAAFETPKNGPH